MKRTGLERLIGVLLLAAVLAVFSQTIRHGFVDYDDGMYVTDNSRVRSGLSMSSIAWAFTSLDASNWHPLTWLSHMLDCQLYGLNPAGHHATNLLFHTASVLLLFLILRVATGRLWESALAAALFALHPLRVESVAWVAERKDVLSAFFWMLTISAYLRYVSIPSIGRYLVVVGCYVLGLMAKPMLVTLPFVLLLLDFWPLGRTHLSCLREAAAAGDGWWSPRKECRPMGCLVIEKLPLFLLSTSSCVVTYIAQARGGTIAALETIPLAARCLNGCLAYVTYLWKLLWPSHLAVIYPHPVTSLPVWQGIAAGLFLVAVLLLAVRYGYRYPFLLVGWLWYLGTLVPVIGVVQVGVQSMADRYTYIPSIGIMVIFAWSASAVLSRLRRTRLSYLLVCVLVPVILIGLASATWVQLGHWKDTESLFRHAVAVTRDNHAAHSNLGNALLKQDRLDEASKAYRRALETWPRYPDANNNLGLILTRDGRWEEAIRYYEKALDADPEHIMAHLNMADALAVLGRLSDAVSYYRDAVAISPDLGQAHNALGVALARLRRTDEAISHLCRAVALCPDCPDPLNNLGRVLTFAGEYARAIDCLKRAIELRPGYAEAYNNLGIAYAKLGDHRQAGTYFASALHFRPDYTKAKDNLRRAMSLMEDPLEDGGWPGPAQTNPDVAKEQPKTDEGSPEGSWTPSGPTPNSTTGEL